MSETLLHATNFTRDLSVGIGPTPHWGKYCVCNVTTGFPNVLGFRFEAKAGLYALSVDYTAASSRPASVQINGAQVIDRALAGVTGSWLLSHSRWETLGDVTLKDGENVLQISTLGRCITHVRSIRLVRRDEAPVAVATGGGVVDTGTVQTPDGSGSHDADRDALTYAWTIVSKPEGATATLSDRAAATPSLTPDVDGDYVLRLVVNDGTLDSLPMELTYSAVTVVPQDLKKVEGIGPKTEQVLNESGIFTYKQLAATPADHIREILKAAGKRFSLSNPTTWSEQAELAAKGEWDALKTLQDHLTGGLR